MSAVEVLQLAFAGVGAGAGVGIFYRLGRLGAIVEGHGERIGRLELRARAN